MTTKSNRLKRSIKAAKTGTQTAVYSNLPPVIAAIFAWLTLGEAITGFMVVGAAMIFLGIYLTRKAGQR